MRKLLILVGCLMFVGLSVQAQITLQPEDYIVNPEALGPEHGTGGDDAGDNKMALYNNAAWPGDPYSIISQELEDISFSNVVHIKFTGLSANQWYDLTANMPYGSNWDYSYISASDAVSTNRLIIPASGGVMYPGQTDGSGNPSIYLGDLAAGGGGYRGVDSFTLTTTTAPAAPPPTQSPKTYTIQFVDYIVNPEVLGSGVNDSDNKMEVYDPWDALIAHYTEDIPLENVVHVKLTGLGLDPSRSYGLKAYMQYPADWDYSYTSAADAVGPAKLTLSMGDGLMEDVPLDEDGNISIYFGDLSNGGAGYRSIDTLTLTVGPVVAAASTPSGTIIKFL